jgi:hypothetical protein
MRIMMHNLFKNVNAKLGKLKTNSKGGFLWL